jgi:hypothetical protein
MVVVIGCSAGLTACSNDGVALARQACDHIGKSIALYKQSTTETKTDPAQSRALAAEAYLQLRDALPLTAQAAGQNGLWQALMTDVTESNRVAESYLVSSLQDQCAVANSANPGISSPPPTSSSSSVPPAATDPPSHGS